MCLPVVTVSGTIWQYLAPSITSLDHETLSSRSNCEIRKNVDMYMKRGHGVKVRLVLLCATRNSPMRHELGSARLEPACFFSGLTCENRRILLMTAANQHLS